MTPRLTTDYAKNYCNRTLIVKVIVENVVTSFYGTQCTPCPGKKRPPPEKNAVKCITQSNDTYTA